LILNLAGTALLFYSFQATSSNFRLVRRTSVVSNDVEESAICVYGRTMMLAYKQRGWAIDGGSPCPDWEHSKAAAVVNIEHPLFEALGFLTLLAGFLLQYLSVPHSKTIAEMRAELRAARRASQK
jgi:hypothetical protein